MFIFHENALLMRLCHLAPHCNKRLVLSFVGRRRQSPVIEPIVPPAILRAPQPVSCLAPSFACPPPRVSRSLVNSYPPTFCIDCCNGRHPVVLCVDRVTPNLNRRPVLIQILQSPRSFLVRS